VGGDEGVVGQVRVGRKDAVDLLALAGLEALARRKKVSGTSSQKIASFAQW